MKACRIVGSYVVNEHGWQQLSNAGCLGSIGQYGLSYKETILSYLYGFTNLNARDEFPNTKNCFRYTKVSNDMTLIEIDITLDIETILITDIKRILHEISDDIIVRFLSPNNNKSIDCELYFPSSNSYRLIHKFYTEGKQRGCYIPNNKGKYKRVNV